MIRAVKYKIQKILTNRQHYNGDQHTFNCHQ